MTQITDHVELCARQYKDYAALNNFSKDLVTKETDEWVARMFTEGSIKSVTSGWMLDEKTYSIVYIPNDGDDRTHYSVAMVFEHFQMSTTDSLSAYDRAMAGI